jgi:hypothetical protein
VVHEDIEVGTKAVGSWRHDFVSFSFSLARPALFCFCFIQAVADKGVKATLSRNA